MKKKFLISILMFFIIFSFFVISESFATDDPFIEEVLTVMDVKKVGVTMDNDLTKSVRTIYAVIQMGAIAGVLIDVTIYSTKFFSSDQNVRSKAKEYLPYRLIAIVVILGINSFVSIIFKYFVR